MKFWCMIPTKCPKFIQIIFYSYSFEFPKNIHFIPIPHEIHLKFHRNRCKNRFSLLFFIIHFFFYIKIKMNCIKFPLQLITTWTLAQNASFGRCNVFSSRSRSVIHKFKVRTLKWNFTTSSEASISAKFIAWNFREKLSCWLQSPQYSLKRWIANGEDWWLF